MIFGVTSFVIIRALSYAFAAYMGYKYKIYSVGFLMTLLSLSAIHPEIIPWDIFYEVILLGFPIASLWVAWDISKKHENTNHS